MSDSVVGLFWLLLSSCFKIVPREHFDNALCEAGFDTITFVDRTAAVGEIASDGMQRVLGELRAHLESRLGESGYAEFVDWTRARMNSLLHGAMGYGHFYTRKLSPCGPAARSDEREKPRSLKLKLSPGLEADLSGKPLHP